MGMWQENGTKIMGYSGAAVATVAAAVTMIDPTLVTAVVGPKYGGYFALAAALFSAAVAKRGHTNTANQQQPPQP
jgi:hypothetical protein